MVGSEFQKEIARLVDRFGERNFSPEFVKLIAEHVSDLDHFWFSRLVTNMIAERRPTDPPLLQDFRIPAYHRRQANLSMQTKQAATSWSKAGGLEEFLKRVGAKNLNEAMRLNKKKLG